MRSGQLSVASADHVVIVIDPAARFLFFSFSKFKNEQKKKKKKKENAFGAELRISSRDTAFN